ncbi:hypothetical protein SBV1_1430023 [Verrucomicrobia bacterium]|nr:hypothetical protein SBV1_1430023 [Verrucomicrobiota bacterium]
MPSRVRARWAKMSRISEVRSSTLQLNTRSRLRLCAGESSSSKITVSTSACRQCRANSSALPLPMKVPALGAASFCKPSPTTCPPAVVANSESSSKESRNSQPSRAWSSTPIRKTRSVLRLLVSISAFNSGPQWLFVSYVTSISYAIIYHVFKTGKARKRKSRLSAVAKPQAQAFLGKDER